ncbi:AMIN-like domain-containing (lipo)protein [Rhodococcus cercidiphylli]|jgi:hypothetical protein|uniref:AMIN-like domain-containing protein n=1 Tax=Rhodococcus cercidiphylli TaxID=489916 RepID=A0ABU4ASV5_9NOCA|nr:hypothetical protein [Rhodococcus cercidiphylli]MDV6229294.1 hypothetical protein [Rhodococcus cercidiphylli]
MYDGHRRAPVALSAVGSLLLGSAAGCAGAGGSGPVDEVSADTNYTTVTGSLVVGDPMSNPRPTVEALPPAVTELSPILDGARFPGASPVGVTDVLVEEFSVEFGLAGNGPVSYTVRYVDEAIRYGTSEPLAVPGRSVLQVDLSGTSTDSDDTFSSYAGPERVRGGAESAIASVDFLADPDGISQAFVGVAADRPAFTVTTTEEPAAVVVTVEN